MSGYVSAASGALPAPSGRPTATDTAAVYDDEGYSIERLRKQYENFASTKSAEIEEQRQARHYYHGDQYTKEQVSELKRRRQPILTNNRTGRKIDGVVGLIERLRQDPKAFARTPEHEQGAELATAVIRYVMDEADWKPLSAESARVGGIAGIGGLELSLKAGDRGDPDIFLDLIDGETFFYDPRSVRHDFSDALYMGVAKWVDLDVAQEMFPDKEEELAGLIESGGGDTWQQQDKGQKWLLVDEKKLFLVEHWYKKRGEWRFCFYAYRTELKSGPSPFKDEKGKTFCRFLPWSAYVDHDGDRYGMVRNMRSAQDEINARRSKSLHILNVRRIIYEEGAIDDVEITRREAARPDGMIRVNPGLKLEFDDNSKQADLNGQLELLNEAKGEIENIGPNPALIGTGVENQSGRAIALMQQAGIAELGPLMMAYRAWKIRVYRAVWNLVQRFWTGERWVRVTDNQGLAQFVGINKMQIGPNGMPAIVNQVGSLDVDIIIDEGGDQVNLMADAHDTLAQIVPAIAPMLTPQEAQMVLRLIIETSPLPSDLKKQFRDGIQQSQAPNPIQQQKQALEFQNAQAQIGATKAKAFHSVATASAALMQAQQPDHPTIEVPSPLDHHQGLADIRKTHADAFNSAASGVQKLIQAAQPPPQVDLAQAA